MMNMFERPGDGLGRSTMPDIGKLWKMEGGHIQLRFVLLADHS